MSSAACPNCGSPMGVGGCTYVFCQNHNGPTKSAAKSGGETGTGKPAFHLAPGETAAHTSGGQPEPPVLFYDFNMPPGYGDGLYSVMPSEDCIHYTGQRVVFGCQSDEVMALGIVEEVGKDLLGVRWVAELPVYRNPL